MTPTVELKSKLSTLPHKPGVYLMKDRFGTVIYVGKARDLRKRVSQYFHPSRRHSWDLKLKALIESIRDLDVHIAKSEADAILLEGRLIKEFKPRYNVSFRDDKRFLLVKVNLKDPIPRFTLTRIRQDDGCRYFGPFASSGAVRKTLTLVRQKFNLRGCRPLTPNENDYKHCLYAHLKVCTAPCIENISHDNYRLQVQAACDFLNGECAEMETQLEKEMKAAAAKLEFEKAAELRDLLNDLRKTTTRRGRYDRLPVKLPVSLDPEADLFKLGEVLNLQKPPHRIEGFDISNISGTYKVASLVSFKNGRPDRNSYRRFKMKTVEGQDDFACMAETIYRRYSRLKKEQTDSGAETETGFPDLILVDGGKGQLNAACEVLENLGLSHIPIIGLAKEFEEIYRPGEKAPLRLGLDHNALKLLQRVRDESHRFANTYNAQLRLKKISESLLDEFPGIGHKRKADLLKHFGSVQTLQKAPVEEIAKVPGFGGKIAAQLKTWLSARHIVT